MNPPIPIDEVKERYLKQAPAWQFGCWICCKEKGRHIYAWPLDNGGYTIRIACDRCKKKCKNTVYWYN